MKNAKYRACPSDGRALLGALQSGDLEMVRLLLDDDAHCARPSDNESEALVEVVWRCDLEMVKMLLDDKLGEHRARLRRALLEATRSNKRDRERSERESFRV